MGFENGQLLRVTLRASWTTREVVNTLHYNIENTVGGGDSDPQDLADRIRDDVVPTWKTFFDSGWSIDPVVVTEEKDPQNPTAPRDQWTSGTTITGTGVPGTGDPLPYEMCALIQVKTAKIGRSFRGRLFCPPALRESDLGSRVWEASAGSNYMSKVTALAAAIPKQPDVAMGWSSSTCKLCVFSRTRRQLDLDPYAEAVTQLVPTNGIHWLRSRSD